MLYTTVSFDFSLGIAILGSAILLALPTRRRNIFDALRHPLGGPDDEASNAKS